MPEYLRDEDRARGYLEKVRNSAQEGAAVVGRMREFYRKQDEDEDFAPVDLSEIAREAISLTAHHWRNQAEARGLHIEMEDRTGEVPAVRGCETDLRQLVTNLILNSVDAMPARRHKSQCPARRTETGSPSRWRIPDPDGSGNPTPMPRAVLHHQGEGRDGPRTVHRLRHRPTSPGTDGSRFGSRRKGPSSRSIFPSVVRIMHASEETHHQVDGQAMNILLIDDEDLLLEAISEHLMNLGHRVSCHLDPNQALACAYKENFDLVITDRAMPGMTGDRVAKSIKEYRPDLPVVMLTGFGDIMLQTGEQPENIDHGPEQTRLPSEPSARPCPASPRRRVAGLNPLRPPTLVLAIGRPESCACAA